MTEEAGSKSRIIQNGIARAHAEKEALAILLSDLRSEQRTLSAVATIGVLDAAQSDRLRNIGAEIDEKSKRFDELDDAIAGARDLLVAALAAERAAVEGAAWDAAATKLAEAQAAARDARIGLEQAGARYADCVRLMRAAYCDVVPHVRVPSLPHVEPPKIHNHVGLILKHSGGPDFGCQVWHIDRFQAPPPLEQVIADFTARFLRRRGER